MRTLADFIDPSSFWSPEYLAPSAWIEHAPFAFWLVGKLRPRSFVELGTHYGCSYFAVCQAVQRHGTGTRCYAVDTWHGDAHTGSYGDDVYQQVLEHHDRHYSAFSGLIQSTFDAAASHFSNGSVDLLHIDGQHYYEDVRHDFDTWAPKLSERAVVLFHDTNVRERDFGVHRLMDELGHERPIFQFLHGHGLGVLKFGDAPIPALDALFHLGPQDAVTQQVRDAYALLGASHGRSQELSTEMQRLRSELKRRGDAVAQLTMTREQLREERDSLRTRVLLAETNHNDGRGASRITEWPAVKRAVRRLGTPVAGPLRRIEMSLRWMRPNPLFDAAWYLKHYPDVAAAGLNPLLHYLRHGKAEGRRPRPPKET